MSDEAKSSTAIEAERIFAAKRAWHRKQAELPIEEKVRILLKMPRDYYPILLARGVLRSWERPWEIEP
jgi:hypothetical protein